VVFIQKQLTLFLVYNPSHDEVTSIGYFGWLSPKKNFYSLWKGIHETRINIRRGLNKVDHSSLAKILSQPIFGLLQVLSLRGGPFKVGSRSEGRPLANKGITMLKHL
jgi:hypothetical protein